MQNLAKKVSFYTFRFLFKFQYTGTKYWKTLEKKRHFTRFVFDFTRILNLIKTMKKIKTMANIIAIMLLIFLNTACEPEPKNSENPNDQAALEAIKKEQWLIDAFITDANVMYISMNGDGKPQNGYAEVICHILKEHDAKTHWVKIVEAGTTKSPEADNAYGVLIGESHCEF